MDAAWERRWSPGCWRRRAYAGYKRIRLETGNRQEEALGLYKAAGFASIPCWGPYATDPKSRCFELDLEQRPGWSHLGP